MLVKKGGDVAVDGVMCDVNVCNTISNQEVVSVLYYVQSLLYN